MSEAKTTAEGAEALRRKLSALEEERSKWKVAAMESHSAVRIKLAAKLSDVDATTRVETTIKALMEKNLQAERDRHEEVSNREVFDEALKSPWAGPTTRTIRNLAKFAVSHDHGSRESLSHSVVYRNIVPYISGRGCTRAFEAFPDYSQPGNEYYLFAVLEKEDGEAVGAIRSRN
ncbi:uncharacterized protein LY79DRAFT_578116 [Colletotrichum navitas]|uniref:Uncharacterized protein n=1 Tax=Colletotrichum navitas TaxID=681940 RepID=A0AAD8Q3U7_9PEZI|nr:uncharacterized protein LY79DRAFT_578116 [Colletotrichum navitas]KAK1595343.1 hypothetical protein LY79DRAFT_578116 [Colletotrichum navitas]